MEGIDFVVTWVDGNDPDWQSEKSKYSPSVAADVGNARYRDMELLQYWFRAVEKYAPWVNKIHFVTWGHLPKWLNTKCDKLNIVKHNDYIPEEYLPTFSSRTIENNIHRIKGLSEKFVYFNDDVFINAPIKKEFFFKKGEPCDFFNIINIGFKLPMDVYSLARIMCTRAINNDFKFLEIFIKHFTKVVNVKYSLINNFRNILNLANINFITGFAEHHLAYPYLKSTFEKVWDKYEDILKFTNEQKFRAPFTVNHYIFRYYQLTSGNFVPVSYKSRGKAIGINMKTDEIVDEILSSKHKVVCINDTEVNDFESKKKVLIEAFEKKFPEKSMFEL